MRSYLVALFAIGSLLATSVDAYELGTHSRLTQNAYEQSVISLDPQLLEDLGVRNTENPFGDRYFDVSLLSIRERGVFDEFELQHMPPGALPLSIQGWLMRGAIREDDAPGEGNPQDDPFPTRS